MGSLEVVLRNLLAVVVEVDHSHMGFDSGVDIDAAALGLETTTYWMMKMGRRRSVGRGGCREVQVRW